MVDAVKIAIADDSDIAELAELRTTWRPGPPEAVDEFSDAFRVWIDKETSGRIFWIARRGGHPIGMVNLVLFDRMPVPGRPAGGWGYLSNMFVIESERNNGVGALLVEALTEHGDSLGLERIVLKPSARATPFYERNGFSSQHELLVRPHP